MIRYPISTKNSDKTVEAIDGGRIVRVPEEYAKREGLLILRKVVDVAGTELTPTQKKDEYSRKNKGFIGMDDLRKPLRPQNDEIMRELVENFHWTLMQKRKMKGLTRKKLAEEIGETELNVRMIENGVIPVNNFVLVNKLEKFYGVALRRNKPIDVGDKPLRQIIDFAKKEKESKKEDSIEIVEDEGDKKKDDMGIELS